MTQEKSVKIKNGFGSDRLPVKAKCFIQVGDKNNYEFHKMEVNHSTNEGRHIISISNCMNEKENIAEMFFRLEEIPALIATLTKVAEDARKTEFKNQVEWNLQETNKFNK
tara:strand:- start:204 stop:533 length:330 start_codon:yes stop_codon:yes gene_type:complete